MGGTGWRRLAGGGAERDAGEGVYALAEEQEVERPLGGGGGRTSEHRGHHVKIVRD
jgi:hypothetical protein